jgi:hypothetical protein
MKMLEHQMHELFDSGCRSFNSYVFFTHFLILEFSSHGLPAHGHFKESHLATDYKCLFAGQETF